MYIAAIAAACAINRQAFIVLAGMLCGEWLFSNTPDNFTFTLLAGILYAINGAAFINLSSSIRHALFAIGCLYWLSAVDDFLFPNTYTLYYNSFSYIIGTLDLYVLLLLLLGGRRNVGTYSSAAFDFIFSWRYRILWLCNMHHETKSKGTK